MWWQRAARHDVLLEAAWLKGPLQDPQRAVTIRRAADHTFVYVSERAPEILGHAADSLLGHSLWDLFLPADLRDAGTVLDASLDGLSRSVLRLRTPTDERWIETRSLPCTDLIVAIHHQVPTPQLAKCRVLDARDEPEARLVMA